VSILKHYYIIGQNTIFQKEMHFGYNNPRASYYIDNTLSPTCTVERDLGVLIEDTLKVSEQ